MAPWSLSWSLSWSSGALELPYACGKSDPMKDSGRPSKLAKVDCQETSHGPRGLRHLGCPVLITWENYRVLEPIRRIRTLQNLHEALSVVSGVGSYA